MDKLKTISLAAMLALLTACSSASAEYALAEPVYPKSTKFDDYTVNQERASDEVLASLSDFSYKAGSAVLSENSGNTVVCPLSAYMALAMAADGAAGETQTEILNVMGIASADGFADSIGQLYRSLYIDNEYSTMRAANSIWVDNSVSLSKNSAFISDMTDKLYAGLYSVDFSDSKTGERISKWISDNTNGLLSPESSVEPEQIMSLVNTIYFKTQWVNEFDKSLTKPDTFHGTNGDVQTDFMNAEYGSYGYSRGENYTTSSLSTKSGYSMVLVLPDKGTDVRELVSTPEKLREIFSMENSKCGEVVFKIPKFETKSDITLTATLKALGMTTAFTENANFSPITKDTAFISSVIQQTCLGIDEVGIEAASFTEIAYCGAALPDGRAEMILDRPFIYGIMDYSGGLIFAGIYENAE